MLGPNILHRVAPMSAPLLVASARIEASMLQIETTTLQPPKYSILDQLNDMNLNAKENDYSSNQYLNFKSSKPHQMNKKLNSILDTSTSSEQQETDCDVLSHNIAPAFKSNAHIQQG